MNDDTSVPRSPAVRAANGGASVTDLAARRRSGDVLRSMTFVFGGVNYGTISVSAPYARGKPFVLYVVPQDAGAGNDLFSGALDCLVTDDVALAADAEIAR